MTWTRCLSCPAIHLANVVMVLVLTVVPAVVLRGLAAQPWHLSAMELAPPVAAVRVEAPSSILELISLIQLTYPFPGTAWSKRPDLGTGVFGLYQIHILFHFDNVIFFSP